MDTLEPHLRSRLIAKGPSSLSAASSGRLRVFLTSASMADLPSLALRQGLSHGVRVLDNFEDIDHLVAALTLSSYIPGGTGAVLPLGGSAVGRARASLAKHWGLKHTITTIAGNDSSRSSSSSSGDTSELVSLPRPIPEESNAIVRRLFDGGLGAMWPTLDAQTVLVSPFAVRPIRGGKRGVICPRGSFKTPISLGAHGVEVDGTMETMRIVSRMLLSSEARELDQAFARGFDDARRFIKEGGSL